MNTLIPYRKIPISSPIVALALFILMMVVWVQGSFNAGLHLLFLFSSYFTWFFLLPFIQGIIISSTWNSGGAAMVVVKAIIVIIIHFILSNIFYYLLQYFLVRPFIAPTWTILKQIVGPSLLARTIDFIIFFGLLSWMQRSREVSDKEKKLLATESSLQTMRLKSLQRQLNPHFLFNTLHTVSSLIGRNDEKARDMTIKISGLLRKVLEANEQSSYPLGTELELIRDYLSIEHERFHDRLTLNMYIDDTTEDVEVPPFILQPIIENAFKHGIAHVEGKTVLSVRIQKDNQNNLIKFEVINDVPKQSPPASNSTGIGLSNLKKRLEAFYTRNIDFSAQISNDCKYVVAFSVPLKK